MTPSRIPPIHRTGVAILAAALAACSEAAVLPTSVHSVGSRSSANAQEALAPFIRTGLPTRRVGDINDRGELVATSNDRRNPVVWSAATGARAIDPNGTFTTPWTISNAGVIGGIDDGAGVIWTTEGRVVLAEAGTVEDITETGLMAGAAGELPALWRNGEQTTFSLPDGHAWGFFTGVSDAGFAVGAAQGADGSFNGILWTGGAAITVVPDVAGYEDNIPVDVNARGQMVGWATTFGAPSGVAYLSDAGNVTVLPGLPGAVFSAAQRITETGVIVGTSNNLPVVWIDREPIALPLPPDAIRGQAVAVNEVGQVVGYVDYPVGFTPRNEVIVWNLGGAGIDLASRALQEAIDSGELRSGAAAPLTAKLGTAVQALEDGNRGAAAGALRAFQNHLQAQAGKHVPVPLADRLSRAAGMALASLD